MIYQAFLLLSLVTTSNYEWLNERLWHELGAGAGLKDTVLVDPSLNLAFRVIMKRNKVLDTLEIMPLDSYLQRRMDSLEVAMALEAAAETTRAGRNAGGGLLPDIEVPFKFPKGLKFLGEGAKLKIDGQQDITFGGGASKSSTDRQTEYGGGSFFPVITMDQTLRVRLTGTVGDKIHVLIDHDSQRQNQLKNKVSLRYEGGEDEVVKLIELGDTRLDFPSRGYASFPNTREGLFGIKTVLQLANLQITTLATKEQGESRTGMFTSGARVDSFKLYAKDYVKGKFFWLGETDSIVQLEVFFDDDDPTNNSETGAMPGRAYFYDVNSDQADSGLSNDGFFNWLTPQTDYFWDSRTNIIELRTPVSGRQIVGVYYRTASGKVVGDISDTSNLRLKLIRPRDYGGMDSIPVNPQSPDEYRYFILNSLELKNIYSLRNSNLYPGQVDIQIYRVTNQGPVNGENDRSYLQILGLDLNGDGVIDEIQNRNGQSFTVLDYAKGYLIFPEPYPFADTALEHPDSAIYWLRNLQPGQGQDYYIQVKIRQRMNQIQLNAYDIIEGSEVVTYNGRRLVRNRDYTIDYTTGTITILNDEVLNDPNADIRITYDYVPFMASKERSILGVRFDYTLGENLSLGSTWITRSEGTIDERPQIGDEPTRATVGEFDMQFQLPMPFMTTALNIVPWLNLRNKSSMQMQFEAARAFPNPNIKGDGYIDDMESAKQSVSLSISRLKWSYGSIPVGRDTSSFARKLIWAVLPDVIRSGDIYPNEPIEMQDDREPVLMLIVRPQVEGDTTQWASLNYLVNRDGQDFQNIDFLEFVAKGDSIKVKIDIGYAISADAIWRDRAGRIKGMYRGPHEIDGEDIDADHDHFDARTEDVGLDRVAGNDSSWTEGSQDDGNDDYSYSLSDKWNFEHIDGTEGNGHYDTEDLDGNMTVDTNNAYFEYTIDLSDLNSEYLVDVTPAGWKHYRIPLKDITSHTEVGTNPTWSQIRYARMWLTGFTRTDTVLIQRIEFVGNKWLNYGVTSIDSSYQPVDSSEVVRIGVVNTYETNDYSPPPGVFLRRDQNGRLEREQSIAVVYSNIGLGHYALVHRQVLSQNNQQDLLDYTEIKFFAKARHPLDGNPMLFFRVGSDENNYYEFRFRLSGTSWHEFTIPFDVLTHLKTLRPDSFPNDSVFFSGSYGVKGVPNLGSVKMYEFGILNDSSQTPISGEVWFDELRASGPRRNGGWAARGSFNFNWAGFITLNASAEYREPDFRSLSDARSQRNLTQNYSVSGSIRPGMLLPSVWGINLALTASQNVSYTFPKYPVGNDIVYSPQEMEEHRELSYSKNLRLQFSKSRSKFWLFRFLFDPFRVNAGKSETYRNTQTQLSLSNSENLKIEYNLNPNLRPLNIFGINFNPLFSNLKLSADYTGDTSMNYNRQSGTRTNNGRKALNLSFSTQYSPFRNMRLSYSQSQGHDLRFGGRWGRDISREEQLSGSYSLNIFNMLTPSIQVSNNYRENLPTANATDTMNLHNITRTFNFSVNSRVDPFPFLRNIRKDTSNPLKMVGYYISKLVNVFPAPNLSYSLRRSANYYLVQGRPDVMFRLGLSDSFNLPTSGTRNTSNENRSYSINGNIRLIRLTLSYRGTMDITYSRTNMGVTRDRNLTWPSLSTQFSQIEKVIPGLNKVLGSTTLNLNYSHSIRENGPADAPTPDTRQVENSFTPSISTSLFNKVTMNLNGSYTLRGNESFRYGPTSQTAVKSVTVDLSYSLDRSKGLKLPLFKRPIRLKSSVTFHVTYTYNDETTKMGEVITGNTSKSFSLYAQYRFTKNVTGGLQYQFSKNFDKTTGREFLSNQLNANVSLKF